MKKHNICTIAIACLLLVGISACKDEPDCTNPTDPCFLGINFDTLTHDTTAYPLVSPPSLPLIDNYISSYLKPTKNGVKLGRMLFYDPILSKDSTQSCATCHSQKFGFTDNGKAFSVGVDKIAGDRNSMQIINAIYGPTFFWDGRSAGLDAQALEPVKNPIEMNLPWEEAMPRIMAHKTYRTLFYEAFGLKTITKEDVARAITMFEITLISADSELDKYLTPGSGYFAPEEVNRGFNVYVTKAHCEHCHFFSINKPGLNLFTDNKFHNNGLDKAATLNDFKDQGYGKITGNPNDNGKFKTPTLRNIAQTAPYMHDGRFKTLEEVIEHYDSGIEISPNIDPIIYADFGTDLKLGLSEQDKKDLLAFLHALTDTAFLNNPAFASPFK
ncbi:MAG: cytochrome-c peroxidase [Sphingobacteriales bacterium]|jgi:cytochrome c peroxidase|nr:cytochrome-c peroxidase [Sphingobacteriales bacterium]MBP9140708.1 cytochrome-c peroxidase [Chitinophagales bacterium]MDA0197957.1 cytochrome-c peroxidase [Bacteroidota bacterium]MBK6890539.1 cytochrome-c peroxidase [Sphingobacteriales bacterium]MBK7526409.1 cytochrome-c peroxidase [Sphingobacteriales bacterium]